ncbi:MAG: cytochrome c [Bacteroidetes bacterium]|nr:cytochrome c [Bacteroidota bacterium]
MKKICFFLLLVQLTILFSCKNKSNPALFTNEMLLRQTYVINDKADTTIRTKHGSLLKIKAGTFNTDGDISIEIKEAFTPAEILAAGLTTESNGMPLRTGGMIYINAKQKDKQLSLVKPINVSVPNAYFDEKMKLYKGVETDSGTVNWVDPVPLDSTPQQQKYLMGKLLFKGKCASCHGIFKSLTGPSLRNVEYRGKWNDRKNLLSFIRNPSGWMEKDNYVLKLKSAYGGQMMTAFNDINEEGLDAILAYINSETKRPGAEADEKRERDSLLAKSIAELNQDTSSTEGMALASRTCNDDTIYIRKSGTEENTMLEGVNLSDINQLLTDTLPKKAESMEGLRNGFTDPNPTDGMYDFEIKTLGWYNIDAEVEGYAGTVITDVKVIAEGPMESNLHVYLFCPSNKTLSVSYDKNTAVYTFIKINGGIPLYLGERVLAFAFGSKGGKMYYGISTFYATRSQQIKVMIHETNVEEIRKFLYTENIEGIDIGIEEKEQIIIPKQCADSLITADTVSILESTK